MECHYNSCISLKHHSLQQTCTVSYLCTVPVKLTTHTTKVSLFSFAYTYCCMKGGQLGARVMIYVYLRLGPISWTFFRSLRICDPFTICDLLCSPYCFMPRMPAYQYAHRCNVCVDALMLHGCDISVFALLQT